MTDEVIEELYEYRERLAKKFNYDVRKMLEHFQKTQTNGHREVVSLAKKKIKLQKKPQTGKKAA